MQLPHMGYSLYHFSEHVREHPIKIELTFSVPYEQRVYQIVSISMILCSHMLSSAPKQQCTLLAHCQMVVFGGTILK